MQNNSIVSSRRRSRGSRYGQSLVEFALVIPVFLALLFGIFSGALLFMQDQSVNNAARGGARAAVVQSSLTKPSGGTICEAGTNIDATPATIEGAAARAATTLPMNAAPLCQTDGQGPSGKRLTQAWSAGSTQLQLDVDTSLAAPLRITVTATKVARPLWPFLSTQITLQHSSTLQAQ